MKFVILTPVIIILLSGLVSGIVSEVSEPPLVEPHLKVEHSVSTPICSNGSVSAPDYSKTSIINLTLEGVGDPIPVDVVFAIDYSNSMKTSDQTNERLKGTKKFIKSLSNSTDRAGLVYWNYDIIDSRCIDLTSEFDDIISKINKDIIGEGVHPEGWTDFNKALNASIDMFDNNDNNTKKCIIFLSNGKPEPPWRSDLYTPPNNQSSPVNLAKERGIEIWTVGFYSNSLSLNETEEQARNLTEIAQTTGGRYYPSGNLTVQDDFIKIYYQMTSLAGKEISIEYHAPSDMIYSIDHDRIEGDRKVFVWTPEDIGEIYIGKSWIESFKVSSENIGLFTLGSTPGSIASYTTYHQKPEVIPIIDRQLEVIPCGEPACLINLSIINITFEPGSIDIHIESENFNIGSGTFYDNCSTPTDPDGQPCENLVCVCVDPTWPNAPKSWPITGRR